VSFLGSNLGGKKLELIRALVPKARTIGVLENPNSPISQTERMDVLTAARAVGQRAIVLRASTEDDFETAFATLVRERAGALLVTGDALFNSRRDRLIALAARHAVPTIRSEKPFVEAGGLMSYGAKHRRGVSTGRCLHRPLPQGREAGGPAGDAADQVRPCHQPQDRQGPRPHHSAIVAGVS
jgi:putative ABC transport system substrate-binding protein